jgi:ABC-2 type transport system permease protein
MNKPRISRVLTSGLLTHFKMLSRSPFDLWVVVASPLIFATLAHFLFTGASHSTMLVAALASGVMGVWSSATASGSGVLQAQRRLGTLELLVAAPAPFWSILLPISVAIAGIGIYSIATGLVYVRLIFGVPIVVENWFAFCVAVPLLIVSIGALGFLFTAAFVRFRSAFMVGNLFEWPIWLICGLLIPISVLPGWLQPVSWLFAPTWGMAALRAATLGHGHVWLDLLACAGTGGAYLVIGVFCLRYFLDAARAKATLALAT